VGKEGFYIGISTEIRTSIGNYLVLPSKYVARYIFYSNRQQNCRFKICLGYPKSSETEDYSVQLATIRLCFDISYFFVVVASWALVGILACRREDKTSCIAIEKERKKQQQHDFFSD
jgi:hypothetical protein